MNFFNKYCDLFGVPQNTQIPKYRLSTNSSIFVQPSFIPTYRESINLNSKIRDLRKDYNQFEEELESINTALRAPKRPTSRKSKDLAIASQKSRNISLNSPQYAQLPPIPINNSFASKSNRKIDNFSEQNRLHTEDSYPREEVKDHFGKKRMSWLKDEQLNLAKHSQMKYVFEQKIPSARKDSNNGSFVLSQQGNNSSKLIQNEITFAQKGSKAAEISFGRQETEVGKGQALRMDINSAIKRRQQSKMNTDSRKQKLARLLRQW